MATGIHGHWTLDTGQWVFRKIRQAYIQGWGGSDRRRSDPDLDPIFGGSDRIPVQFWKLGSDRRFPLFRSDPGLAGFFVNFVKFSP